MELFIPLRNFYYQNKVSFEKASRLVLAWF